MGKEIKVVTVDSGFGGFFTAKAIEKKAREIDKDYDVDISVTHYGDTKNAPYGEKSPAQIADLTTSIVKHALSEGADMVFIACNTASTQYATVKQNIEAINPNDGNKVISIIDKTSERVAKIVRNKLSTEDEANIAILATPATIKSEVYPKKLAELLGGTLFEGELDTYYQERWDKSNGSKIESDRRIDTIRFSNGKSVKIYQDAPGNWVDLIEKGGSETDKQQAVARDINILAELVPKGTKLALVGEFCTHYPVFDTMIQQDLEQSGKSDLRTKFVTQGGIMAKEFEQRFIDMRMQDTQIRRRSHHVSRSDIQARLFITGDNIIQTRRLADSIFPSNRLTLVNKVSLKTMSL